MSSTGGGGGPSDPQSIARLRSHLGRARAAAEAAMATAMAMNSNSAAGGAASASAPGVTSTVRMTHLGEEMNRRTRAAGASRFTGSNTIFPPPPPPPPPHSVSQPVPFPTNGSTLICNTCSRAPVKAGTNGSGNQTQLARCSGCRAVYYCSKTCQRTDWNKHKFICRHVRTMDQYRLPYLKLTSSIPGNYHRPVLSFEKQQAALAASLGIQCPPVDSWMKIAEKERSEKEAAKAASAAAAPTTDDDGTMPMEVDSYTLAPFPPSSSDPGSSAAQAVPSSNSSHSSLPFASTSANSTAAFPSSLSSSAAPSTAAFPPIAHAPPSSSFRSSKRVRSSSKQKQQQKGMQQPSSNNGSSNGGADFMQTSSSEESQDEAGVGGGNGSDGGEAKNNSDSGREKKRRKASKSKEKTTASSTTMLYDGPSSSANPSSNSTNPAAVDPSSLSSPSAVAPPDSDLSLQPVVVAPNGLLSPSLESDIIRAYGPRPSYGQTCLLFFQGRFSNGTIFTKNRGIFFHSSSAPTPSSALLTSSALEWFEELKDATPLQFTLGIGEVIECWDQAVSQMFKGEVATILTRDEYRQVFVYELHLVDFW